MAMIVRFSSQIYAWIVKRNWIWIKLLRSSQPWQRLNILKLSENLPATQLQITSQLENVSKIQKHCAANMKSLLIASYPAIQLAN